MTGWMSMVHSLFSSFLFLIAFLVFLAGTFLYVIGKWVELRERHERSSFESELRRYLHNQGNDAE